MTDTVFWVTEIVQVGLLLWIVHRLIRQNGHARH